MRKTEGKCKPYNGHRTHLHCINPLNLTPLAIMHNLVLKKGDTCLVDKWQVCTVCTRQCTAEQPSMHGPQQNMHQRQSIHLA